jgi:hypothetical protein
LKRKTFFSLVVDSLNGLFKILPRLKLACIGWTGEKPTKTTSLPRSRHTRSIPTPRLRRSECSTLKRGRRIWFPKIPQPASQSGSAKRRSSMSRASTMVPRHWSHSMFSTQMSKRGLQQISTANEVSFNKEANVLYIEQTPSTASPEAFPASKPSLYQQTK